MTYQLLGTPMMQLGEHAAPGLPKPRQAAASECALCPAQAVGVYI